MLGVISQEGATALVLASERGHVDVVSVLIKQNSQQGREGKHFIR